jgi:hypothetical protein
MNPSVGVAVAPFPRISGLHDKLILTYDNSFTTDGAGSQLQRIYGTYAISRLLGASYLHTPLRRVDNQGFLALQRNVSDANYHRQFNDLFQIESDVSPTGDFHSMKLHDISLEIVDQIVARFDEGGTDGRPSLVQLGTPYGIAERFPDCYEVCKDISPFATPRREGRTMRAAIHVRRGELLVVESHRMLANAYYISVAQNLARKLDERGVDYQLELHTETTAAEFVVQSGYPGLPEQAAGSIIRPDMCGLDEFDALPNLVRCINDSAIDCLRKLATADILVMSRSSFSYVAAILNKTGIVLCYPFWHGALSSWLTVEPDGQFDQVKFERAIEQFAWADHDPDRPESLLHSRPSTPRPSTIEPDLRWRQAPGLEMNEADEGVIVYQRDRDRVHFLNPTAALLLESCGDGLAESELAALVAAAFDLPEAPVEDVARCVKSLLDEGLLVTCEPPTAP